MPRSGTTLVEQILSSHSKVSGAGELNYFSQSLNNHVDYKVADEMFRKIKLLNNETISLIGKNYVSYIDKLNFKTPYVVDKNPINFQLALLISVCLPQAKIIHCLRDPRDTCFSIFKNYFWQNVMPWSYNIDELTQFYKLYLDLMNFYHSIIDEDKILKLNYENLTLDPSNVTKQLIQFCGLEWEDQCLEFYKNKNTVKTASVRQVRNKIYKTSNKQWENYKDYLPDLFKNLP